MEHYITPTSEVRYLAGKVPALLSYVLVPFLFILVIADPCWGMAVKITILTYPYQNVTMYLSNARS